MLFAALLLVAAASPSPSPTPVPKFTVTAQGANVFVDQATDGIGTTPIEGPGFAAGSVLAPMSPYDWFSSAPTTPGIAGISQYVATGTYHGSRVAVDATVGGAFVTGDTTNASYWSTPLMGPIDPHRGSGALPYVVAFPTQAATNDTVVPRLSLLGGSIGGSDGSWRVRGGFFDLVQSDRFVFAAPPVTNVNPSLGAQTAETIGPGMPSLDAWSASATALPLLGTDAVAKMRSATLELSDGLLPALPGTSARLTNASIVVDRGDSGRFSAQVVHLATSGDPINTTTLFGAGPTLTSTAQGELPSSMLADQRQTIAGLRAFFHPHSGYDALVELGRAWYDAGLVARPGTSQPGSYEHFSLARHFSDRDALALDYYRFEPRYATAILPYGVPENVWSVAWSWPGPWLKSNYQLVDSTIVGINRAGYRAHYDHTYKRFELHAAYAGYRQIEPATLANSTQTGFVEGFFLPQQDGFGTYGTQRQFAAYVAWHLDRDDIALDFVRDALHRDFEAPYPQDYVAMRYPQIVGSWQHHFSKQALAVAGYGRYSANGMWATTPVLGIYTVGFVGGEVALGDRDALLLQLRRYGLTGLPSEPGGPPPTMRGTALVVEQQVHL